MSARNSLTTEEIAMPFATIPAAPVSLTVEQTEIMEQRQIKKHHVAIVLLHWFNAVVWLMELATGAAIIVAPGYRFMPIGYLRMLEELFGTRTNLLRFHITLGLIWIMVFLVYGAFGWKHYLHAEVLRKEIALDRDDFKWLQARTLMLVRSSSESLPPQGAYNAGQKLYALMIYAMVPVIMITGTIMTFHWVSTAFVAWAMLLHFVAVGMVVSGLLIHVYMGAVFPEERPAFYSMITGMVNELYAYRHHFKWWREVKIEEARWATSLLDSGEAIGRTDATVEQTHVTTAGD
jgi:formate dehydrogenase subunit gamma